MYAIRSYYACTVEVLANASSASEEWTWDDGTRTVVKMSDRSKDALSRRDFLRTGIAAGALLPVAGLVLRAPAAWAEEEKLVTETPAMAATVQA